MDRSLRITIVDDQALTDPFYSELLARFRQDLPLQPTISWIDAEKLLPAGKFDPKQMLADLRKTGPDLILLDLVLHQAQNRHDLILSGWLTKEIRRDPALKTAAIVYLSKFFHDHYPIPEEWRPWCFAKQDLLSDEVAWSVFKLTLEDPLASRGQQRNLRSLTTTLLRDQRQ
jgi:CheY-like chemotaxis protein